MRSISELPYSPSMNIETINLRLKKTPHKKISYNRFRWWRWADKISQNKNSTLLHRIKRGEFDNYIYYLQAIICENMLNDLWLECKGDILKYNEKSVTLRARKEKLLEDYWKNEEKSLKELPKLLSKHFKIEEMNIINFMGQFDGTTEELYIYIDENKVQFKNNLIKFINGIQ